MNGNQPKLLLTVGVVALLCAAVVMFATGRRPAEMSSGITQIRRDLEWVSRGIVTRWASCIMETVGTYSR
ncbi:MAG: hypothetical protein Q7T82_12765 [Armatimonadota bacterium]|nr:hypothetical protein [Armatimonadota bacterium]